MDNCTKLAHHCSMGYFETVMANTLPYSSRQCIFTMEHPRAFSQGKANAPL